MPAGSPGTSSAAGGILPGDHLAKDDRVGVAGEQPHARERLPQNHRARVDVGARVERLALELLGRHVRELALDLAAAGGLHATGRLGDTEVEQPC